MTGRPRRAAAAGALVAALVLTGCGGADGDRAKEKDAAPSLVAAEVCHGLFAGPAERALATTLGAEAFSRSTDDDTVGRAAAELAEDSAGRAGGPRERRICTLYKNPGSNIAELTVDAERVTSAIADAKHTAPAAASYRLGRSAWADPNKAVIYVDCTSPKAAAGTGAEPAVLAISAWNRTFPQGEAAKYREANLTLAHAAAVAIVKELGCKDGAGLPDRLTVQELPATG